MKNKERYISIVSKKLFKPALWLSAYILVFSASVFAEDQPDALAGIMKSVTENFGLKSAFIKMLYLMEIYYGWHKWRQTGNPWSAAGIVIVAMFLTYAIPKWVTTAA